MSKRLNLSVSKSKTEVCALYHKYAPNIEIVLINVIIKLKNTMNVLGVMFDSTLNWLQQISYTTIQKYGTCQHSHSNLNNSCCWLQGQHLN